MDKEGSILPISEVAARLSVDQVVTVLGIKREGRKICCPNPSHGGDGDQHPSAEILDEGRRWRCYVCPGTGGRKYYGGDAVDMYAVAKGLSLAQAANELARLFNISIESPWDLSEEAEACHAVLKAMPRLVEELGMVRGWSETTIDRFLIGYDPELNRITIPVFFNGIVPDIRCYKPNGTLTLGAREAREAKTVPWFFGKNRRRQPPKRSGRPYLFNWEACANLDRVIIMDGEPDVILAAQDGLPVFTWTCGHNAWRAEWALKLQGKHVFYVCDRDEGAEDIFTHVIAPDIRAAGGIPHMFTAPEEWTGDDYTEWRLVDNVTAEEFAAVIWDTAVEVKPPVIIRGAEVSLDIPDGWLSRYVEEAQYSCDAPTEFHALCGLIVLATCLGKRACILGVSHLPIVPHLYCLLVARSGALHKTTAISIAKNLVQKAGVGHRIYPEQMSTESFLSYLSGSLGGPIETEDGISSSAPRGRTCGTFFYDEFGTAISGWRKEWQVGIPSYLTKLYDGLDAPLRVVLRSRTETIPADVAINIIAGITEVEFYDRIRISDVSWGFICRFLIAYRTDKQEFHRQRPFRDTMDVLVQELRENVTQGPLVACSFEDSVMDMMDVWDTRNQRAAQTHYETPLLEGVYMRGLRQAQSIALLMAAGDGELRNKREYCIGGRYAETAMDLVDTFRNGAAALLSAIDNTPDEVAKMKLWGWIAQRGPVSESQITQSGPRGLRADRKKLRELLGVLIGEGRISKQLRKGVRGPGTYIYRAVQELNASD